MNETMIGTKIPVKPEQFLATQNMEDWLEKVAQNDLEAVVDLYNDDCTFLPTVSGELKTGQNGAEEYFEHFLAKNPTGKVTKSDLTNLADNLYIDTGKYTFEVDGKNENRVVVPADFTYVWKKDENGKWEILHHHSAQENNTELKSPDDEEAKTIELAEAALDNGGKLQAGIYSFENENDETVEARYTRVHNQNNELIHEQLSLRP